MTFEESAESNALERRAEASATPRGIADAKGKEDASSNTKPTIDQDRARSSLNDEQTFI